MGREDARETNQKKGSGEKGKDHPTLVRRNLTKNKKGIMRVVGERNLHEKGCGSTRAGGSKEAG